MYLSRTGNNSNTPDSIEELTNIESNLTKRVYSTNNYKIYKYPPPPRLVKSANNSCCSTASTSDSSVCSTPNNRSYIFPKKKRRKPIESKLPPLGIYWDIENCQVPRNKSAAAVVQRIRETFLENYRESEFTVVCDIKKESPHIIQELHDSQVMLIHVSSLSKNAADEKLRQSLRRFGEIYSAPAGIVLISSDINFAADLSDLRYRKKIRVILVHNVNVADALILCANEHHYFSDLLQSVQTSSFNSRFKAPVPSFLTISNLPLCYDPKRLKNRLLKLTDNCGGKIVELYPSDGIAHVKFGNFDAAVRAQRRIQGENVFGNKIKVLSPSTRLYSGRQVKSCDISNQSSNSISPVLASQNYQTDSKQITSRDFKKLTQASNSFSYSENYMFRPIRGAGALNSGSLEKGYDQSWNNQLIGRRSLTPQELLNMSVANLPSHVYRLNDNLNYMDDVKMSNDGDGKNVPSQPVDLIISNLDPSIDIKELQRLLTNMIEKYATMLSLNIVVQTDGTPVANIRVSGQQQAQFIISQLHRQKLGHKRIIISYAQTNSPDPDQLKAMVIEILQEVPDKSMPLFKFINLLESRYHCTISVSEVNKLKDVCRISDGFGSRTISLIQELKVSPIHLSKAFFPYCIVHSASGVQSRGWCELNVIQIPNVMISLKPFATKLITLLEIHMGFMPFLSFQSCYEQVFNELLPVDDLGVPLEHLISCVPNIEIKLVGPNKNIKVIKFGEMKNNENDEDAVLKSIPPPLAPNVSLLCRELVDLLKTTDKCQLLLSKFIPAYHHHFGRQCRVADYGYTKLLDLFESITHVVQIMGDGTKKIITLSHMAQMRRFTSDLLRVLKVQPLKQISMTVFPVAYEKVMNKPFNAVEYGLCIFEDLLQEVPEKTIVFSKVDEDIVIAIPKREQTSEEILRTKQFATEVIDLLRHSPYYTMLFNKFVPAYHHHFGHQCKVSDYGFTKLIELFEAIPETVKIEEQADGERTVSLVLDQAFKVLGSQIVQLLKSSQTFVPLNDLTKLYLREYGYPLKPHLFECDSLETLLEKLSDYVKVQESDAGSLLAAIEVDTIPNILKVRFWGLLLQPPHCKDLNTLHFEYQSKYNSNFTSEGLEQIKDVILISSKNDINFITLAALYILAVELYYVVFKNGGSVSYNSLEKLYSEHYGKSLKLSNYHIHSVDEFYNCFNLMFFVRGSKKKSIVMLNRNLAEHSIPLPPSMIKQKPTVSNEEREVTNWPPPPPPEMVQNMVKKVSPPKPDTPPSPNSVPWMQWNIPSADSLNLSIQLPIEHNPKLLYNTDTLISPARQLLPTNKNLWQSMLRSIPAPDPTELPMPDQLIPKCGTSDDSTDSGLNITNKMEQSLSDNENEVSMEQQIFGIAGKSEYAMFLNFNN